jgi:hypothetical protein
MLDNKLASGSFYCSKKQGRDDPGTYSAPPTIKKNKSGPAIINPIQTSPQKVVAQKYRFGKYPAVTSRAVLRSTSTWSRPSFQASLNSEWSITLQHCQLLDLYQIKSPLITDGVFSGKRHQQKMVLTDSLGAAVITHSFTFHHPIARSIVPSGREHNKPTTRPFSGL